MTDHTISTINLFPDRQLLGEFTAASHPDSNRRLLDQATAAVQGLGLPHGQVGRIRETLHQALARMAPVGEQGTDHRLRIRIWVLGACTSHHGWGFFVVEKDHDRDGGGTDGEHLVELFLYQECTS